MLTNHQLVKLWELGLSKTALQFSLEVICAAYKDIDYHTALNLPIGVRDSLLLELYSSTFNSVLSGVAECPTCMQKNEWSIPIHQLNHYQNINDEIELYHKFESDGYKVLFRLVNSHDVVSYQDNTNRESDILSNCISEITLNNKKVTINDVSNDFLEKISDRMECLDSLANIEITTSCTNCQSQWNSCFDIITFLWAELNSYVKALLHDVGIIASHFGWSEEQIFNLPPSRRRMYLEMLGE